MFKLRNRSTLFWIDWGDIHIQNDIINLFRIPRADCCHNQDRDYVCFTGDYGQLEEFPGDNTTITTSIWIYSHGVPACLSVCLSVCLSASLFICLSFDLSIRLSVCLSDCPYLVQIFIGNSPLAYSWMHACVHTPTPAIIVHSLQRID